MSDPFTSLLYFFSAVLEADAAILGLGIVFIVYKMQTLYSEYQDWVTTLIPINVPNDVAPDCDKLLRKGVTKDEVEEILKRRMPTRFGVAFESIANFDSKRDKERWRLIPPVLFFGIHCFLTSTVLWSFRCLSTNTIPNSIFVWGWVILISFGLLLAWLFIVAYLSLRR